MRLRAQGRWKGALVAIKVVEHGPMNNLKNVQREAMLSTALAHPNIVSVELNSNIRCHVHQRWRLAWTWVVLCTRL